MKKLFLLILLSCFFILGCASRDPNRGLLKSPCACITFEDQRDKNA